jgi:electron transport complex protein RnfG
VIKSILKLVAITVASIVILATYHAFIEIYAERGEDDVTWALLEIIPGSVELKPVLSDDGEPIYYEAFDAQGFLVGYGFVAEFRGMWSDIRIAGGLDINYRLTGIVVLEQGETPGLGSRIETPWFREQFVGLTLDEIELTRYGGKVDAISGATVTSKVVIEGIRTEMGNVVSLLEAGR